MESEVDADVAAALEAAFPGRTVESVGAAGISWNEQNETVRVAFAGGETVFLKVAVEGDATRPERERALIEYVGANCDVAVPSVVASGTVGETPYLATAPVSGRNLAEVWEERDLDGRTALLREIGAALAEVHAQTFKRHGHVVGGTRTGLKLETGNWTDVLRDGVETAQERAPGDRFEDLFAEADAAIAENRDLLDGAPAALVHGDPAHPNLFRSDAGIGFLDWEIGHVGDPARELRRAEHQLALGDSDRLVAALREGYRRRAGELPSRFEERKPVYDVVWQLNKLAVFDRRAEQSDRSIEEVAQSARNETNDLLDAIR